MKRRITLIVFAILLLINVRSASATEIALEPTWIPEGNFSILLHKPVRSELPLRDKSAVTIIAYSYQSYFSAFDVSYAAGFTDWTPSKEFYIKKKGYPLTSISEDLDISVRGMKVMTEKRLQMDVNLLESREKKYENHLGREAKFEFFSSGSRYIIRYRTYMIGYKEYWQQVVYPQQYEGYVRPQTFLDSFKLYFAESEENKSTNKKLWDDKSYTWFANIIAGLTKLVKTTPSKIYAEQELRQLPNSKPRIKNRQYQGQIILFDNKEFMLIFFSYSGDHVSGANIAIFPIKKEKMLEIYDLVHGSLSKLFVETEKNVFDAGNGYYASIEQNNELFGIAILIFKAKNSAVQ